MPSNAELIDQIKELDPEAELEGFTNARLAARLKELKTGESEEPEEEQEVVAVTHHFVSEGKAVTCKKGKILTGDGPDVITPEDLEGGESAFSTLLEKGVIKRG